jgi:hypothetical protein
MVVWPTTLGLVIMSLGASVGTAHIMSWQTGSRERKRHARQGTRYQAPASTDLPPPARPHLLVFYSTSQESVITGDVGFYT